MITQTLSLLALILSSIPKKDLPSVAEFFSRLSRLEKEMQFFKERGMSPDEHDSLLTDPNLDSPNQERAKNKKSLWLILFFLGVQSILLCLGWMRIHDLEIQLKNQALFVSHENDGTKINEETIKSLKQNPLPQKADSKVFAKTQEIPSIPAPAYRASPVDRAEGYRAPFSAPSEISVQAVSSGADSLYQSSGSSSYQASTLPSSSSSSSFYRKNQELPSAFISSQKSEAELALLKTAAQENLERETQAQRLPSTSVRPVLVVPLKEADKSEQKQKEAPIPSFSLPPKF